MKRWCSALLLLFAGALTARAHFVWIVPSGDREALLIFSDTLKPDRSVPVTKIGATRVFLLGDREKALRTTLKDKTAYRLTLLGEPGPSALAGVCRYGVVAKGKAEPFLLVYCARALVGGALQDAPAAFWKPAGQLPLDIVLIKGKPKARLLWQGKPVADAEVVMQAPGTGEELEVKTDEDGVFVLVRPKSDGLYALRARHVVAKEGEEGGKKYKEVRYYCTLTFPVRAPAGSGGAPGAGPAKANPEATRLLREARAARVNWQDFPGFTADLEYNHNGKAVRGKVTVSAGGKVTVDLADPAAKGWAQRQLRSVVDHRLDNSAERNTPCAFLDDNAHHPLGRAVRVLNDELHSSYRIRDRQIIEVNRRMKDSRFTITVLHNYFTAEKKYLPASYVVNTWDKAEALRSSTSFHQTWRRVGAFDLPGTVLVVTASGMATPADAQPGAAPQTLDARTLRLTNHKLGR
jgi:hypothetical protein